MKRNLTITFLIASLLFGSLSCTSISDTQKAEVRGFLEKHILGKSEEIVVSFEPVFLYYVADGTGSGHTRYAIPKLDTINIRESIHWMHTKDGGKIWVTFIDNDSRNNPNCYLTIPAILRHPAPVRNSGETSFAFSKRETEWKTEHEIFLKDSIAAEERFEGNADKFLVNVSKMLDRVYSKGTPENQWTDAIGVLNSAITSMVQMGPQPGKKLLVCFSDLEQDAPYLKPQPALIEIPSDITIVAVNPIIGSSKKITNQVIEVEHPSRVFELFLNHNHSEP